MAEGSTSGGRHARIMLGHGPVFGPTLDALVREVESRMPDQARAAHHATLEEWPIAPDGAVMNADALFDRLTALRAAPAPLPAYVRPGSLGKALAGLVLGGAAGLPLGFLFYLFALVFGFPGAAESSDTVMSIIVLGTMAMAGAACAWHGLRPTRLGEALSRGLIVFVLGGIVSALLAGIVALTLGEVFGVSQMEGAFAMGVVFTIMPAAGFLGGLFFAIWAARQGWRRWGSA